MAELKSTLLELVECPICYEIFHEPKALQCLHTLCSNCVSRTASWNGTVKCPLCSQSSGKRDIKKDFRTQELVTLFSNFEALGWTAVDDQHGDALPDNNIPNSTELTLDFCINKLDMPNVTQFVKYGSMYWFVLQDGKIFTFDPIANQAEHVEVAEKRKVGRGILGGIVAGLAVVPFSPALAVVAAAGAFVVGSNLLRSKSSKLSNKAQLMTCTRDGTFVVLCESNIPDGVVQRLFELDPQGVIKCQIGDLHYRENIQHMYSVSDVVCTTDSCTQNTKYWHRANVGTQGWRTDYAPQFKHEKETQLYCEESAFYTMDGESLYKYSLRKELVSAHNIPAYIKGKLAFCGTGKAQVVLRETTKKCLHILDTKMNSWSRLKVPDPEWKLCCVHLDQQHCIHVLCAKVRTQGYRMYTHCL